MRSTILLRLFGVFSFFFLFACSPSKKKSPYSGITLNIVSGSENKSLEPLVKAFGRKHGFYINIHYKGSVEIMVALGQEEFDYDAVWPANSLWISMGDTNQRVKHLTSIMSSPVVFGIKKSLAKQLGFVGNQVSTVDLLNAITDKKFSFMMTSATQSNSGASAYIGFLYALLGSPKVLKKEMLYKPLLRTKIKQLLRGIHRSSGSSGWLKELFLKGNYSAMVNYEAMIIETNQKLVSQGKEPLYVVYPADGTVLANSPLGFVALKGNKGKEQAFLALQNYLRSKEVQATLSKFGRRTSSGNVMGDAKERVFDPDWGIDVKRNIAPIKIPRVEVIREALHLYQMSFRKPSFTIFCLDYSDSMRGVGAHSLKKAMALLLDTERSKHFMIQSSVQDKIVVIPYAGEILGEWRAKGGDPASLKALAKNIVSLEVGGKTDIYTPIVRAIELLKAEPELDRYVPAIILMTDGVSNVGKSFSSVRFSYEKLNRDVPVFSILFGEASRSELSKIQDLTRGRIFDGKKNLVKAFRLAKGYN